MKINLFKLLLLLIIFQQFPIVFENFYEGFRLSIYIVFSILIIVSIPAFKMAFQNRFIFRFFLVLIYALFLSILSHNNIVLNLGIPFFALLISIGIKIDEVELKKLLRLFVIGVTLMGIAIVFYYADGFSITTTYSVPAKNGRGPIIGYAILIAFINIFNKKYQTVKFLNSYLSIIVFSLNFFVLLTFRNRASILGIIICSLLILFSTFNYKQSILKWFIIFSLLSIIIVALLLGLLDGLYNYFWDSITLSFDITDIDSLSAGRTDIYIESLQYSLRNPIAGEILYMSNLSDTPHNYILYNWVKFGMVISLPLIFLYLNLWNISYKNIINNQDKSLSLWLILFALIVSLFEYTYPYGPGVSQLFMWFLFGQYLQQNSILITR